jgi:hypothetical protein
MKNNDLINGCLFEGYHYETLNLLVMAQSKESGKSAGKEKKGSKQSEKSSKNEQEKK